MRKFKPSRVVRRFFENREPTLEERGELWRLMALGLTDKEIDRKLSRRIKLLKRAVL